MARTLNTAAALDWEPRPKRRKDPPTTMGDKLLFAAFLALFVAAALYVGRCDYLDQEAFKATAAREAAEREAAR